MIDSFGQCIVKQFLLISNALYTVMKEGIFVKENPYKFYQVTLRYLEADKSSCAAALQSVACKTDPKLSPE